MQAISGHADRLLKAVPVLAALVVLSFAMTIALLIEVTNDYDQNEIVKTVRFMREAFDRLKERQAKQVQDYAAWGDAYRHLHIGTDVAWAYDDQNLGPTLYRDFGYDEVLVIGANDTITYAVTKGKLATASSTGAIDGNELRSLVSAARQADAGGPKPATGLLMQGGSPFLAAAAQITPGGDPTVIQTPGTQSVLVFVYALTPERLDKIGAVYFAHGLRSPRNEADRSAGPFLDLEAANGAGPIRFRWDPERPGQLLLAKILPCLVLVGAVVVGLTALTCHEGRRAARQIETSAKSLAKAHSMIMHSALHDALTGLPNRLMLSRYLEDSSGVEEPAKPFAVIYADLDGFKPINDSFGHTAGDRVLTVTATRLRKSIVDGALVARLGGDEFVLIYQSDDPTRDIHRICARLIEAVQEPIQIGESVVQVGVSIGAAFAQGRSQLLDAVRCADLAMYEAKKASGKTYRIYDREHGSTMDPAVTAPFLSADAAS